MYARDHAAANPDQPAIVMAGSGQVVTYAELEAGANQLAHLFRQQGLAQGDHVAFFVENDPGLLVAEAAAERTGLFFTLVNSYLSADEAGYIVDDCQARVVVSSWARREVAAELRAHAPRVERWLMLNVPEGTAPPAPYERYDDVVAGMPTGYVEGERLGAAMLYSSGTTGRPKGILRHLPDVHPAEPLPVMQFVQHMFGFRPGMRYLSPAPLYHSAPQASVSATIRLGATAVVMERFDPEQFLRLVEEHRITNSQLVPTMFTRMLKLPEEVRSRYDLSSLEVVVHAAAPCPVQVKEQMIAWWGPKIVEYYGATEANGFTFCTSEEWLAHKGTVGKAILGTVRILDEDGQEQPTGTPGTVWFEGATAFEYFGDPEKTASAMDPTRSRSTVGDVGYLDEDGFLHLTDRKSYMIISGGVNIYPQETEDLLITHPKVMDAAVIGVPDEDLGEVVKAVVQLMPEVEPSPDVEQELITFCRERLARFKVPRSVDFEPELPRLPTGKLYKRLLRDKYWAGHQTGIL